MSETSKAVFLSYASQDAEAARRISEALRAAGIEVWFDQSELVGGDAWDQKIRRQIKECTLFVPVVSANTQARLEGYFRLEWKLAEDRSHLMAKGTPFLLPICLDDTRDADAIVPDSFMTVQWTRLPGGEADERFCARMKALLSGTVDGDFRAVSASGSPADGLGLPGAAPTKARDRVPPRRRVRLAATVAIGLACLASLAIWRPWRKAAEGPVTRASLTDAQKFTQQARALFEDPMDLRENLMLADDLARRAAAADPTDAEAWAIAGRVSAVLHLRRFDASAKRKDDARQQVERAMTLAPNSLESALALAAYYNITARRPEAERLLTEWTQRAPNDRRVWRELGLQHMLMLRPADALGPLRQAQSLPGGDAISAAAEARALVNLIRLREADEKFAQVVATQPSRRAHFERFLFLGIYVFDVPAAKALLETMPPRVRQEDAAISTLAEFFLRLGDGERALAELQRMPRDFFEDGFGWRPKGYCAGYAHQVAGRPTAAQAEWKRALAVVEKRLAAEPGERLLLYWKCVLQALTGQVAEAREGRKLLIEVWSEEDRAWFDATLLVALGENEAAIAVLLKRWPTASFILRSDIRGDVLFAPWFAPIRNDPRIQAMAAEHTHTIEQALGRKVTTAETKPDAGREK